MWLLKKTLRLPLNCLSAPSHEQLHKFLFTSQILPLVWSTITLHERAGGWKPCSHPRKGLSEPVKGRSVYLESWHWVCARCVQQVCGSAEKALSLPQGCVCAAARGHSAATQSWDSSLEPCWMKGSLCSLVWPDPPPFLCAQPVPPFLPSLSLPKTGTGHPMGTLSLCTVPERSVSPLPLFVLLFLALGPSRRLTPRPQHVNYTA